ncbi:hypothetical protein B4147_5851 [Bacillus wiedmannii]|uniref:Uncharacterized protein n=1 Tax=Bacillus wiedmannii TaxID=1890302 RepID=A0A0G8CD57_9BACI|nr:hypothetical protein [Bacillus wiedmannii]KKZ96976.1 hypothetical protein B4147_5851 [Bacillus wiedmannii]
MNKKLIIGIIAVLVAIIASVVIFKDSKSEDMKPKYSQKDMDKLIDQHFNEQQDLKTQIKELKSKVDSYEKEQTRSLQKTTQPSQETPKPQEQEQPKKEDVKPESQPEKKEVPKQEQTTGTLANPVKSIDKTETMNKVKEKAKKDFPDDYSTQNYVANKQSKAFDYLNNIEIKSQEELNIINKALRDFPTDFSTAKYVYERQMKAKGEQEAQ